jgi:LysM repeat protein
VWALFSIEGIYAMRQLHHLRRIVLSVVSLLFVACLLLNTTPGLAAGTYVVQTGDSLFTIAARFNVGISDLATVNHIYDVNNIFVGETLTLPAPLPAGYYSSNPVYTPPSNPGYTVPAPVQTYYSYVIRPGDYLGLIAARFGTSVSALIALNAVSLPDPSLLYVGQTLLIPNKTSTVIQAPTAVPVATYHGNFYVVQPGDTLYNIALRFGQDMYNIARVNGILNLTTIYAGTSLLIP